MTYCYFVTRSNRIAVNIYGLFNNINLKFKLILFVFCGLMLFAQTARSAGQTFYWTGNGADANWTTLANWSLSTSSLSVPTAYPDSLDQVSIGEVNFSSLLSGGAIFKQNGPTITGSNKCASISMGYYKTIVITCNGTLKVMGTIKQDAATVSLLSYSFQGSTLAGTGTINCANVQVGDNSTVLTVLVNNTLTLTSTVNNLHVTGGVSVYSTNVSIVILGLAYNNATFSLQGGSTTIDGQIYTNNTQYNILSSAVANPKFSIDLPSSTSTPVLYLTNATPINSLSVAGSIDFYNNTGSTTTATATVNYSGTAQTVYTTASSLVDTSPAVYDNLTVSGSGAKTPSGSTLTVYGDFTNTLANDASNYVSLTSITVTFNGVTQNMYGGPGNGTTFGTVNISGSGTKTMQTGKFSVASSGLLTMGASCTLATGNILTLNSDATGSATVNQVPSTAFITGNANVQRYVGGGSGHRAYRLMSSPVNQSTIGTIPTFGFTDLQATTPITGGGVKGTYSATQPANGFDPSPTGNPSVFFYYEPQADPYTKIIAYSDYKGIASINEKLPVGNGCLFFFRGNRNTTDASGTAKLSTTAVPENTTLNFYGKLNQQSYTVYIPNGAIAAVNGTYVTPTSASGVSSTFSYTTSSPVSSSDGWHIVGNPYASSIDIDAVTMTNPYSTSNNYVYILNNSGTFGVYTKGSGSTTLNNGVGRYLPTGGGFFVRGSTAGAGVQFSEACKVTSVAAASTPTTFAIEKQKMLAVSNQGDDGQVVRSAVIAADAAPQVLHITLALDSMDANETVIQFDQSPSVKNTFDDHEDAYYVYGMSQTTFMASYTSDGKPCIVNQMATLDSIKTIPLYAEGQTTGLYTMKFAGASTLNPKYKLWLKDNLMKDSLDLSANNTYTLNIDRNNAQTYGSTRFVLVVTPTNIGSYYHLQFFNGANSTSGVKLTWVTQYEGNYTTFTVQRSIDGGKTYQDLRVIQSNGSGSYSYIDAQNIPNTTRLYKLKQNNIDSVNSYSKVVTIGYQPINALTDKISVFPNPTTSYIKMNIDDTQSGKVSVKIFDVSGNIMLSSNTTASSTITQDVSGLQKGMYIIHVTDSSTNKEIGVGKFVKM